MSLRDMQANCNNVQAKTTTMSKQLGISSGPPILAVQIKRFRHIKADKFVKMKQHVEYREDLAISVEPLHEEIEIIPLNFSAVNTYVCETISNCHYTVTQYPHDFQETTHGTCTLTKLELLRARNNCKANKHTYF